MHVVSFKGSLISVSSRLKYRSAPFPLKRGSFERELNDIARWRAFSTFIHANEDNSAATTVVIMEAIHLY